MKKGIFGTWFREFATIVFTQTVQAFLLAIVLSVIVSALAGASSSEDSVGAAGLLAIIALSSFGKIELLVKNIFGVTSSFGDPGSLRAGKGFTAGTALALRGASNLKDNIAKFGQSRRLIKEGKKGLTSMGGNGIKDNSLNSPTKGEKEKIDDDEKVKEEIREQTMHLDTIGNISELTQAIRDLSKETQAANKTSDQAKREKYQDMINQGKNLQRSAVRENIGATIGGIGGAIVGLAQGEDIAQNAMIGAGAGDSLGKASAQATAEKQKYRQNIKKLNDEIQNLSKEDYNKGIEELEKQLDVNGIASRNVNLKTNIKRKIDYRTKNTAISSFNDERATKRKLKELQNQIDKNTDAGQ